MEIQAGDAGDDSGEETDGKAQAPRGVEHIHPDADVFHGHSEIHRRSPLEHLQLPGAEELGHQVVDLLMTPSLGLVKVDHTILAENRGMSARYVYVRESFCDTRRNQRAESLHCSLLCCHTPYGH